MPRRLDFKLILSLTVLIVAISCVSGFLNCQPFVQQRFVGWHPCRHGLAHDLKELLHELGHTFGLTHCTESKCVMSLATHIGLVDSKEQSYCERCGEHLAHRFAVPNGDSK